MLCQNRLAISLPCFWGLRRKMVWVTKLLQQPSVLGKKGYGEPFFHRIFALFVSYFWMDLCIFIIVTVFGFMMTRSPFLCELYFTLDSLDRFHAYWCVFLCIFPSIMAEPSRSVGKQPLVRNYNDRCRRHSRPLQSPYMQPKT